MDQTYLGLELGSTRIKAVAIDTQHRPVSAGEFTWSSVYENGIWTYSLDQLFQGIQTALSGISNRESIAAMGISGMMHGYLAFDKDWNLLVPFRTWQNTITARAADELTELFNFNIPQRWSIAHLYQAVLNKEPHVPQIAHITTLAGYVHYMLTGVNAIGVGEASGMFPICSETGNYDETMLCKFEELTKEMTWNIRDLLPKVLTAGDSAGELTSQGAQLIGNLLPVGIRMAPPEGDAGTGMTATNAVGPRTGNVSAGTSIFSMVVLEKPLKKVYQEIDLVTTPGGRAVAMVHCNNCTNDLNAWFSVLKETAKLFGAEPDSNTLYTKLFELALSGDPDCGNVLIYNYVAGEGITHLDEGRPMVVRRPDSRFDLANFIRSQLYATMATLKIGMDILAEEDVTIDRMTGHGGLFKTPLVGQKFMAAACNAPISCMETAGEGGPYGMALLAAYMMNKGPQERLEDYLDQRVFVGSSVTVQMPDDETAAGFRTYLAHYIDCLEAQRAAVAHF